MKKLFAVSITIAAFVAIAIAAVPSTKNADLPTPPAIGSVIDDFTLPDTDGKDQKLATLKGKSGTLLIFMATKCPVSNAYNERMEQLARDYKAKGINVVGINANSTESPADVKQHAAAHNLSFPILKDNGNKIADRLGANVTPEAFLLDSSNKLMYHGRIDNAKDVSQVSSSDLREALDSALAGKPIAKTTAAAFGCSIKRAE